MSSTRSNKFLSTRYLEYRLEDGPNDDGDTLDYFQNPFQFSFLILPNQSGFPQLQTRTILEFPSGHYNTCVWRLVTYCPTVIPLANIFDATWGAHARSGTLHFDGQTSASSTAIAYNQHMDIFHSNVVCSPPAQGTEYPASSLTWYAPGNGASTELRAIYDAGNIKIQLSKWIELSRVKCHVTIF